MMNTEPNSVLCHYTGKSITGSVFFLVLPEPMCLIKCQTDDNVPSFLELLAFKVNLNWDAFQ